MICKVSHHLELIWYCFGKLFSNSGMLPCYCQTVTVVLVLRGQMWEFCAAIWQETIYYIHIYVIKISKILELPRINYEFSKLAKLPNEQYIKSEFVFLVFNFSLSFFFPSSHLVKSKFIKDIKMSYIYMKSRMVLQPAMSNPRSPSIFDWV